MNTNRTDEIESLRAKVHELTLELSQEAFGRGVAEARLREVEKRLEREREATATMVEEAKRRGEDE